MAERASCDQEVRSGERRQPSVDTAWVHIVGNDDWRFACESQNFLHKIRPDGQTVSKYADLTIFKILWPFFFYKMLISIMRLQSM